MGLWVNSGGSEKKKIEKFSNFCIKIKNFVIRKGYRCMIWWILYDKWIEESAARKWVLCLSYIYKEENSIRGIFIRKQRKRKSLSWQRVFAFLFLLRLYLVCFLLKTAVAIPLKKSRRKINVFLMGIALHSLFLFNSNKGLAEHPEKWKFPRWSRRKWWISFLSVRLYLLATQEQERDSSAGTGR